MKTKKYDFIVVGTGAGGATLAWELTKRGREVLVLEKGSDIEKLGSFRDILNFYDCNRYTKTPKKSKEGVIIYRTLMGGGTTVVAAANMVRCFEDEFKENGINLSEEFAEAENEMNVKLSVPQLQSSGSKAIYQAALSLGYDMQPMPKAIDEKLCINCGMCVYGCKQNAKWTAKEYLKKAVDNGATIEYESPVDNILIDDGKANGVRVSKNGNELKYMSSNVILAAGGLGSPVILQNSNINNSEIGKHLYIDTFVNVYGISEDLNQAMEPPMEFVDLEFHQEKGFILSPFINRQRMIRFIEAGQKGMRMPTNKIIGMMIKTTDTPNGRVYPDGEIAKSINKDDKQKLMEGIKISKEILTKAGADKDHFLVTNPQGAHPGGTCGMGKVVDNNLKTQIDNLYVCDSSIFPTSPGLPPILTIVALSKRLAKNLAQ
jgi:choline dehydrogenase-like flavoprotein